MKVSPLHEEVLDLRHKIHIMNAENFIKAKNEHLALISQIDTKKNCMTNETKEKVEAIRRKGIYYSVRGGNNFVRYTHSINELNNGLRRILACQQTND